MGLRNEGAGLIFALRNVVADAVVGPERVWVLDLADAVLLRCHRVG